MQHSELWEIAVVLAIIALWLTYTILSKKMDDWTFRGR